MQWKEANQTMTCVSREEEGHVVASKDTCQVGRRLIRHNASSKPEPLTRLTHLHNSRTNVRPSLGPMTQPTLESSIRMHHVSRLENQTKLALEESRTYTLGAKRANSAHVIPWTRLTFLNHVRLLARGRV